MKIESIVEEDKESIIEEENIDFDEIGTDDIDIDNELDNELDNVDNNQ